MSKKNSSANLSLTINKHKEFSKIYLLFKSKLNLLKKKSFLIAVSGGPDSLALTALSKLYSYETKCKFFYVLVDHNLRKNSSKEAKLVKQLLSKHKIPLRVMKNKKKIDHNIQNLAREIRYNFLTSFCKKKKIPVILTAHNLEDQVETFFIRLSRGSGLDGLSSMRPINKLNKTVTLARPLLEVKKEKLINISNKIFGGYFKDPSNRSKKFLRIRIRKLKIPLESSGINYDRIFQSIKNLASSRDTLNLYFMNIYKDVVVKEKNKILIDFTDLNKLNTEMQMRVLKKAIKDVMKSYYSPRSKKILNLLNNVKLSLTAKLTLGGCVIMRHKNHLIVKKEIKV